MKDASSSPPHRASEALLGVAVAAAVTAGLLLFHPGVRGELRGVYDEGNTVAAGWRVAEGQVLYRDFWTMHAPGMPHLLAAAFVTLGTTVVVERGLKLAVIGLLSALGYFAFRRFLGPLAAAMSIALGLATNLHPVLLSADTAMAAMLAALLATSAALERGLSPTRLVYAGALVGLTACFRHDFGVYAGLAASAVVALSAWSTPGDQPRWASMARALMPLWAGAAAPVLVTVSYFFARGALKDMIRQMVVFPLTKFEAVRGIRLPALDAITEGLPFGVLFWLTPVALATGAVLAGFDLRRSARSGPSLMLVSLTGLLVFNYARVRADIGHLQPALLLAIPVFVALGSRAWRSARDRRHLALGVAGGLALASVAAFAVAVAFSILRSESPVRAARLLEAVPQTLPAAGVLLDPNLEKALVYLDARVPPGAPIFVGNQRHDAILFNCSLCYFLLQRPSPTRYYNLHPGMATTWATQAEIVARLESQEIEWVLLWDAGLKRAPERRKRGGATRLDAYLASRYERVARYGAWEVQRLTRAPAPSQSALGYAVAFGGRDAPPNSSASPDSSVRGWNPNSLVSSP